MSDLIDRQQAIEAICMETCGVCLKNERCIVHCTEVQTVEKLPPAQPEIIRCKDCKHWIPYDWMFSEVWRSKNMADYSEDEIGCNWCDMTMNANDFCSRGERKTDGKE